MVDGYLPARLEDSIRQSNNPVYCDLISLFELLLHASTHGAAIKFRRARHGNVQQMRANNNTADYQNMREISNSMGCNFCSGN
jgi:hypothetical protein